MAVVNYTITVAPGSVTISPSPDEVTLVTKDYLEFSPPVDPTGKPTGGNVYVNVTGESQVVVAISDTVHKVVLQNPTLDAAGNVIIAFENVPGDPLEGGTFPP